MSKSLKLTKVSDLPKAESIDNLLTLGVDSNNNSVKVPIELLKGNKGDQGNTPSIGANGNWWIGGTDTGKPARGEDGNNLGSKSIYNVSQANNNYAYADKQTARNAVLVNLRALGQIIVYKLTSGWVTEQFVGVDVNGWGVEGNWESQVTQADIHMTSSSGGVKTYIRTAGADLMQSFSIMPLAIGSQVTVTVNNASGTYAVHLSSVPGPGVGQFEPVLNDGTGVRTRTITTTKAWSYVILYSQSKTIFNAIVETPIVAQGALVRDKVIELDTRISSLEKVTTKTNIAILGDSITTDLFGFTWVSHLNKYLNNYNSYNFARGWATWCHKTDTAYNVTDTSDANVSNNVIWNQYNRLKKSVDDGVTPMPKLIIIFAGTNDFLQKKEQGIPEDVFDLSINYLTLAPNNPLLLTTAGAIRYVCELIIRDYPDAWLYVATPLVSGDAATTYEWVFKVENTIKECARRLSIKVIDQTRECGIYVRNEKNGIATTKVFTEDGTHLNERGADRVAQYIASVIRNSPPFLN